MSVDERNDPWRRSIDLGEHPTRLPLEIGTSALWNLTRSTILLPWTLGLGLFVLALGPAAWLFGGLLVVLPLLGYLLSHVGEAFNERPTDVLLGESGLRIEGKRGIAVRWEDFAPQKCRLVAEQVDDRRLLPWVERPLTWLWRIVTLPVAPIWVGIRALFGRSASEDSERHGEAKQTVYKLALALASGQTRHVGEAETKDERASLQALLDTIQSRDSAHAQPGETGRSKLLVCPECGAAVDPAAAETVKCGNCGASVPVPAELAQRIEAAHGVSAASARIERITARLLRQPGATRVKLWLLGAFFVENVAWVLALVVFFHLLLVKNLNLPACGILLASTLAAEVGVVMLTRYLFIDRHALRVLTLDFAAEPPRARGEPQCCRQCGAPLVESPGRVVVRCVYCEAENILGLDLRRRNRSTREDLANLEQAFARRRRARLAWGAVGAVAVCLLGAGGTGFASAYRYRSPETLLRERCVAGKRPACEKLLAVSKMASANFSVAECQACLLGDADDCEGAAGDDQAHALRYLRKGCQLDKAKDCAEAGRAEVADRHQSADGLKLYQRACDLRRARACTNLAIALEQTPASRKKNAARILRLYDRACTLADVAACQKLADVYEQGRLGTTPDPLRGLVKRGEACEQNSGTCAALAKKLYRFGGFRYRSNGTDETALDYYMHKDGLLAALDPDTEETPLAPFAGVLAAEEHCEAKQAAGCKRVAEWYEQRASGAFLHDSKVVSDRAFALQDRNLGCKMHGGPACSAAAARDLARRYRARACNLHDASACDKSGRAGPAGGR